MRQCYETPTPDNLFIVNEDCEKLPDEMAGDFHTIVAKTLYVTKRARPDTCLSIAFLTTRLSAPDRDDWEKLRHLVEYLRKDHARALVLGAKKQWVIDVVCQCFICSAPEYAGAYRWRFDNGEKVSHFSVN
jgi:hypothetical protein